MIFEVSEAWTVRFPASARRRAGDARCGQSGAARRISIVRRNRLESQLRERFAGQTRGDLDQLPVLQAYAAYYKRFKKTYHVQLQLESIAFKGKPIPSVAALVEAMFMAEVKNMLLTAGHDLDALQLPARSGCLARR